MNKRVNVYIDGSNFHHACRRELKRSVNLGKFAKKLVGPNREHRRTYYYTARIPLDYNKQQYYAQQRFFSALDRTPYFEVRLGRLMRRDNNWIEKGVDMLLGIDLLRHATNNLYDTAIVVSGDGDFIHAVQAVKDTGKDVEVAFFEKGISRYLLRSSDLFRELKTSFFKELYI